MTQTRPPRVAKHCGQVYADAYFFTTKGTKIAKGLYGKNVHRYYSLSVDRSLLTDEKIRIQESGDKLVIRLPFTVDGLPLYYSLTVDH